MAILSEQEMRIAIAQRNTDYDCRFFYGVITTGVFCKPSCTTRSARPENLRFYFSVNSALRAGYRPCKRCQPTNKTPALKKLEDVARYIETHVDERLTLSDLAKRMKFSPSHFQRIFKTAFGVSPKSYQDAIRMKQFKHTLKEGSDVTGAIFSAGFGSISRIYGEEKRNIGMTPKAYRSGGAGEIISYVCRDTALGPLLMAATNRGVCFVQFGNQSQQLIEQLGKEFPRAEIVASPANSSRELDDWIDALNAHISNDAPRPDLPLDMRGTAFQIKVWRFLLSVRDGEVISYGELASNIEKPKAVRAVASACAANRIGVLVPCHRVLRGDGSLGGYRWGLDRKRALLDAERSRKYRLEESKDSDLDA